MSIEDHKWSDNNVIGVELCGGEIEIECESWTEYPPIRLEASFNKNDALAIAKHFNVDNESLVEGVKELIAEYHADKGKHLSADYMDLFINLYVDLQKLITKEE
jgi:hypothetical protein